MVDVSGHKKNDIIAIVKSLYDFKKKESANRICNIYLSKGIEFLKKLLKKIINHIKKIIDVFGKELRILLNRKQGGSYPAFIILIKK